MADFDIKDFTLGTAKTIKAVLTGGKYFPGHVLYDEAGAEILGEVTASPTANTIGDRLKALLTGVVLAAGTNLIGKVGIDQTTPGTTDSVSVKSQGHTGSASFTCGTTAYAAGDVVGTSGANAALDLGVCGASGGNILINGVELEIDTTAIISGETSYNLYLYNVTPPSAINDSSPFDIPSGDRASFLGKIPIGVPVDEGSTLYVSADNIGKQVVLSGTHLFGYLVSVGAYTPTARAFKVTIHTVDL